MKVSKLLMLTIVAALTGFLLGSISVVSKDRDTYICKEYQAYIYDISEKYCVCPELIMAIIETESSGRADAVNGGCIGLMQVYEEYHIDRMKRLGVTNLYDPYQNILVGVDILMEYAKYGEEDLAIALGRYHGEKNVRQRTEKGHLSKYVTSIMERSHELEMLHYGI